MMAALKLLADALVQIGDADTIPEAAQIQADVGGSLGRVTAGAP